jgi:CBS domain-containing protein
MPAVEQKGPDLTRLTVRQLMSESVLTCRPETPARDVARTMAIHAVHVVPIETAASPPRVVAARELAQVACSAGEHAALTAEDVSVEAVTAGPDEPLPTAAARMLERNASHLVVVDETSNRAVGVLSDADIVSRWAWPG